MTAPSEPAPGAPADPATPPTGTTPPATPPAQPPTAAPPWERDGQPFDPQRAWNLVESLRGENSRLKQERAQDTTSRTQLTAEMARLLGLAPDTTDPAVLAEQIEDAQDAAWRSGVELALYKTAPQHAAALLDSLSFIQSLDGIEADPGTPEFATALGEAVKAAMERNPSYTNGQAPTAPPRFAAGADGGARAGTSVPQLTESDLSRMNPEQIVDAQEKGQLNDLLGIR